MPPSRGFGDKLCRYSKQLAVKKPSAEAEDQETQVQPPGREDALEGGMATHSSVLA